MLQKKIGDDFLAAFKAKDEAVVSVLRMLKTSLSNRMIEKKMAKDETLDDSEVIAVIKSEVKKRKDSAESYVQGGRQDLADKETAEVAILEKYLPAQLSEDQVREQVRSLVQESGFGPADFGKAMGAVMGKLGAAADGQVVSKILKEELGK